MRSSTPPSHSTNEMETTDYDIILIGGGITGLATAAALLHREQFPPSRLLILEKAEQARAMAKCQFSGRKA